jgi:beta-fructofuranosidase
VRSSPDGQEHTDIHYHWDIGRLVLDRSHSSLNPEVKNDILDATYFPDKAEAIELDVFLDQSVLEVFIDQRTAFAARIYPTLATSVGVSAGCQGAGAIMESVTISPMKQPLGVPP